MTDTETPATTPAAAVRGGSGMGATPRRRPSRGLTTVLVATVLLFVVGGLLDGASLSSTSLSGMLPVAAVLAVAGMGQMLVVQQGGIDLSVAGGISLAVVVVTHVPHGEDGRLLPAVLLALVLALAAGLLNGVLIGLLGLNAIIATLGTNALLYGVDLQVSGGRPRTTTPLLADLAGGTTLGIAHSVVAAVVLLAIVTTVLKATGAGRRFEAIGANPRAGAALGLRVRRGRISAYVAAQVLYCLAGILIAGITAQPIAYAGDTFLLPSIAVVVLGGTSLLGGRGHPLATVVAAVFLQQLITLVAILGASPAISPLVQAAALALGVSLYTLDWRRLTALLPRRRPAVAVPAG